MTIQDTERAAVFIDGSNLYHSLEENCGRADLDFQSFTNKLLRGKKLYRVYYYNVLQDPEKKAQGHQEQQKFLTSLYNIPNFEVKLGTAKYRGDQLVEKGVDIMLATDLLQFAWRDFYDVAILVSGDADFTYAVQVAKNSGKHVEIAAFPANLAYDLAQVGDDRLLLDADYFSELWVGSKRPQRRRFRRPRPSGAANGT